MASRPSDGSGEPQDSEAEQRPSGNTTEETPIVIDRYEVLDDKIDRRDRVAVELLEAGRLLETEFDSAYDIMAVRQLLV